MKLKKGLKSMKSIFIGICIFITMAVLLVLSPWIMLFFGTIAMPNPPAPEIKYAEFPFKLEYELNGEILVIEDVVVCEFDGFETLSIGGKYRKWKSYLKSGNEKVILLQGNDEGVSFEIYVLYGVPEYYMGDFRRSKEDYEKEMTTDRYFGYVQWENGVQTGNVMLEEEVWDEYKLRIIDNQYSKPIENTFK